MDLAAIESLFNECRRLAESETAAAILTLAAIIAKQPPALGIGALLPPRSPEPCREATDLTPTVTWDVKCPEGKWPAAQVPGSTFLPANLPG